ncbi:hypothetical protein [Teichococcus vastitatis]|jgi:hypothetical protein|uniref:Uncharacterized protein n=1 Tax=Teichococcus vastitatis TaxID=2307076 RepID=A0ABS9W443_9PROT|nr:hypothetical protein [Pseudoroseomonas vastitatis]MCI0753833.1 hypothetical protein [Pseudoroseomonas vastitatis]
MTDAYYVRATIEHGNPNRKNTSILYVAMAESPDAAVLLVKGLRGLVAKCEATGEIASLALVQRWGMKPGMAFAV